MQVILSSHMGMCFGVRDAISAARAVTDPVRVTIHGELVHNPRVIEELDRRGFARTAEADRSAIPATPKVLITAHGVSERERTRLEGAGKALIDTTCPLVRRVHEAARELRDQGYFVVVLGRRGHVEVEGIVGDLERFAVIQTPDEARAFGAPRIGIVCQSTTAPDDAARLRDAIATRNPAAEVRFIDTICSPTRAHQEAVLALLRQVEAVVVVGGRRSNNTLQLGRMAEAQGVPWILVERPEDLEPRWFAPFRIVGLTAGTSTPDETIGAVHRALLGLDAGRSAPVDAGAARVLPSHA